MKAIVTLSLLVVALNSCDLAKQALGQVVISVANTTDIDGFEVFANGEKQFTLDSGDKESFSLSGLTTSSIRIVVRHRIRLNSDLVFVLANSEAGGGSAKLVISTEIRYGQTVIVLICSNCGESSKPL